LARAAEEAAAMREEASRRVGAVLAVLSRAVDAAQEADRAMRAEIQAAAPRLAFGILEVLLGREVALATNPGQDAIARVLALDADRQPATVRLNPADVDALDGVDLGRVVRVVADPMIEPGGALAEIGKGTLDGQLGPALERVRKILLGPGDSRDDDDRAT
jgi:flagellar assembly protein FliH